MEILIFSILNINLLLNSFLTIFLKFIELSINV